MFVIWGKNFICVFCLKASGEKLKYIVECQETVVSQWYILNTDTSQYDLPKSIVVLFFFILIQKTLYDMVANRMTKNTVK